MTREQMLAAFAELEAMLDAKVGGWDDAPGAAEFKRTLQRLEAAMPDSYARGKLRHAATWCDILFSARRHEQWARDGGQTVRQHMRADLMNARLAVPSTSEDGPGITSEE